MAQNTLIANLRKSKKRNSDLIKRIYKLYFKNYFKFHSKKNQREYLPNRTTSDQKNDYFPAFTCMFQSIFHLLPSDFYMDIVSGKLNDKNAKSLSHKNNWVKNLKNNKLYKLTQISKPLRYLVTLVPATKSDFIQFLENDQNAFSLKNILKNEIEEYVSFITGIYQSYLQHVDLKQFDTTLNQLGGLFMDVPYTMSDIEKGIETVKKDMESSYNKKIFMDSLRQHYSFKGSCS